MQSIYENCSIFQNDEKPIANAVTVDLQFHQKAITAPESTVLWRGVLRPNKTIAVSVSDILKLTIPGKKDSLIEILEPQNATDHSISFRGVGKVPQEKRIEE